MNPQRIPIGTTKKYEVIIGKELLPQCGRYLREQMPPCTIGIITDSNVAPLYLNTAEAALKDAGFTVHSFVFPAGESSKNLHTLQDILEFSAAIPLTRSDGIVALGGGVTGDMAGFAAGCYLRGIRYVQMPTTLLAAVDSSVGGKTAVNLSAGKNLAGLFLQPELVLCDISTFDTLTPEIFADGVAEAIKTAILGDAELFSVFEKGNCREQLSAVIAACVRKKGEIVAIDEKEAGLRRLLNLGHTIGHAIEKCSDYRIHHGHAVAIGTAIISRAAEGYGWTKEPVAERICHTLTKNQLPVTAAFSPDELAAAASSDKKRQGDRLTLVIPETIGHCITKDIDLPMLREIIAKGMEDPA